MKKSLCIIVMKIFVESWLSFHYLILLCCIQRPETVFIVNADRAKDATYGEEKNRAEILVVGKSPGFEKRFAVHLWRF